MNYKGLRRFHAVCRFAVFIWLASASMLHARTDIIDRLVAVVDSDVIMLSDVRTATRFGLIPDDWKVSYIEYSGLSEHIISTIKKSEYFKANA